MSALAVVYTSPLDEIARLETEVDDLRRSLVNKARQLQAQREALISMRNTIDTLLA